MNETAVTLDVDSDHSVGRFATPDDPAHDSPDHGVLVVPGAGHGPFGDVFDRLTERLVADGHAVARFETWAGPEDLRAKAADEFAAELAAIVAFLRGRGCSTVAVVAKSFGGRLALEHTPDVDRMVLWAPAVFVGDHDDRPSVTVDHLAGVVLPVRLLQGDADEVVSVENSRALADALPDGDLVQLPDEDHSFLTDEERVVRETAEFLRP